MVIPIVKFKVLVSSAQLSGAQRARSFRLNARATKITEHGGKLALKYELKIEPFLTILIET